MSAPSARALDLLSRLLGVAPEGLGEAFRAAGEGRYRSWNAPKGNGRFRRIDAPAPELKHVQRMVLDRLLYRAPVSPYAHGFVPGRSIVTNAFVHRETARAIVSADLEDAYPSVTEARACEALEQAVGPVVKDAFPAEYGFVRGELFGALASLVCHGGVLPQGAPTSGAILNFVCSRLDRMAAKLVRRRRGELPGLRYSRYADDLTFTASVEFPGDFTEEVARLALRSGFRLNRRKLDRTTTRHRDLVICGIRIGPDGRLSLPRRTLKRYRALFHRALAFDPRDVPYPVMAKVTGTLGFLTMVTPVCPRILARPLAALVSRHGEWLRPSRRPEIRTAFPKYGEGPA